MGGAFLEECRHLGSDDPAQLDDRVCGTHQYIEVHHGALLVERDVFCEHSLEAGSGTARGAPSASGGFRAVADSAVDETRGDRPRDRCNPEEPQL